MPVRQQRATPVTLTSSTRCHVASAGVRRAVVVAGRDAGVVVEHVRGRRTCVDGVGDGGAHAVVVGDVHRRRPSPRRRPRGCAATVSAPSTMSATTTRAPSRANSSAATRPSPAAAPVISAVLPARPSPRVRTRRARSAGRAPGRRPTSTSAPSTSRNSGMRFSHSSTATRISMRARLDPAQRWMPTPNATWRLSSRSMTTSSARSNASGSRLAAGKLSRTRSPSCTGQPAISVSAAAMRAIVTGEYARSSSSMAVGISSGSATSRRRSASWVARCHIAEPMPDHVVSMPATRISASVPSTCSTGHRCAVDLGLQQLADEVVARVAGGAPRPPR